MGGAVVKSVFAQQVQDDGIFLWVTVVVFSDAFPYVLHKLLL